MKLQQLAMDAILEAEQDEAVADLPEGIEKTDNGDGTITLSLSFELDPAVVARKAKAMPKGVKRDDLSDLDLQADDEGKVFADDIEDEAPAPEFDLDDDSEGEGDGDDDETIHGDDDDDEDPFNGVNTEDSGKGIFGAALDSIEGVAMDARQNSRHSQTPLENCRAKDPRFCPYHGVVAWKSQLEGDLKAAGLNGSVEVSNDNGKYKASVTVPSGNAKAASGVIDNLLAVNGVKHAATGFRFESSNASGDFTTGASFQNEWGMLDKTGQLNEWVDDYMTDVASDPNAEFDMNDLDELLGAQEDLEAFEQKMDKNNPADVTKYDDMVTAAHQMYHSLMAQQYMKDVKDDKGAQDKHDEIMKSFDNNYAKAHGEKDKIDAAKRALFGGKGTLPNGFAKANAWANDYNKASQGLFYWKNGDVVKAEDEYTNAANSHDLKKMRTALAALDYRKDNFEQGVPAYEAAAKKFQQDLYDWASKDAKYSGKVATAFPNGRPA